MTTWDLPESVAATLAEAPLLARLALVSIELAVLAAIVGLLILLLRIRAPRVRALLWLLVLAKPTLGFTLGTPIALVRFRAPAEIRSSGISDRVPAERPASLRDRSSAGKGGDLSGAAMAAAPPGTDVRSAGQAEELPGSKTSGRGARRSGALGRWLLAGWLLGVLGSVGFTVCGLIRIRQLGRAGGPLPEHLRQRLRTLAAEIGLQRPPRLQIADGFESPALVGLLRPCVLLPRWVAETVNPAAMDWLLRHELMHWKLRDPLGLAVRRLAEILFFFHPATWWAGRRWEEAMEQACDRALLQTVADARLYAEQLYQVLRVQRARCRLLPGTGLFATRTQIGQRIAALLADPLRSPASPSTRSVVGLTLVALLSLPAGFGFDQSETSPAADRPEEPAQPAPAGGGFPRTPDNPLGLDEDARWKFYQAGKGIRNIQFRLRDFHRKNSAFPSGPSEFETPVNFVGGKLPSDPFSTGSLRLVYAPDRLTICSVGPDGNWDGGKPLDPEGPDLDGDLVVEIDAATADVRLGKLPFFETFKPYTLPDWRRGPSSREMTRPVSMPDPERPNIIWGPEVKGLRAALELVPEKEAYVLGEGIDVRFRVKNVSDREIQLPTTTWRQDHATAEDEQGKKLPVHGAWFSGWPRLERRRLAPGGETVIESTGLCLGEATAEGRGLGRGGDTERTDAEQPRTDAHGQPVGSTVACGPGRYFVYYLLRFPDVESGDFPRKDDWKGFLVTGAREVVVGRPEAAENEIHPP
jgi:beta-lactamase regulating signal transducer with metallopeptidase domain